MWTGLTPVSLATAAQRDLLHTGALWAYAVVARAVLVVTFTVLLTTTRHRHIRRATE